MFLLLLFHFFLLFRNILASEHKIHNADELIDFSNSANSGTDYSGITVCLENDIHFTEEQSKKFEVIGKDRDFIGSFDGKGHVINNLAINASAAWIGLFGYSTGLTAKNVVLDKSCSVTSYFDQGYGYMGGIVGECYSENGPCNIENSVNMANVTFIGDASGHSWVGGIAGDLLNSRYNIKVTNCVNYGTISHLGRTGKNILMGGIAGEQYGNYTLNCLNYGTIINGGYSLSYRVGGIIGKMWNVIISNCINAGEIVSDKKCGNIAGYIAADVNTSISSCYWTGDTNTNNLYGHNQSEVKIDSSGELSFESIEDMNCYAEKNNLSKWVFNPNNCTMIFMVNDKEGLSFSTQLILFPDIRGNGGASFSGWYTDTYFTQQFSSSVITENTTVYALYGTLVKVALDLNYKGNAFSYTKVVVFNTTYGNLPEPSRTGYSFIGWLNHKNDIVTNNTVVDIADNHVLYAQWRANNYTVKFDANGGNVFDDSYNITATFDSVYGDLPEPTRTGYSFIGWFNYKNETVTNDTIVNIADDHILYAQWRVNNYTVKFDTNGGNRFDDSDFNITVTFGSVYGDLPEPSRTGYSFIEWFNYKNDIITNDTIVNIADNHVLYANWTINKYNITYIFNNGTDPEVNTIEFNATIYYLEDVRRKGYKFSGWNRSGTEFMPAKNIVVTAQWTANNYTVSFDANEGNMLSDGYNIIVTFNGTYGNLPVPTREGYKFVGWFSDQNENITKGTVVSITDNHTLHAWWKEVSTTHVEIVFDKKDMSNEEIREIIEKYTDADFIIIKAGGSEASETKIIVKFTDVEEAESFVENIKTSSETKDTIKSIDFTSENVPVSLASLFSYSPLLFIVAIL